MKIHRNRSAKGNIPLSFTQDELEYVAYILRMNDWYPNKEADPLAYSVYHKIKNAGRFAWKY